MITTTYRNIEIENQFVAWIMVCFTFLIAMPLGILKSVGETFIALIGFALLLLWFGLVEPETLGISTSNHVINIEIGGDCKAD